MSYNDEFESLIRNFKLDDPEESPPQPPQRAAEPPRREPREPVASRSRAPQTPATDYRPRASAEDRPRTAQRSDAGYRPYTEQRADSGSRSAPPSGAGKSAFRVQIDENTSKTPPSSGGGGSRKPPNDRGFLPPDDDDDDDANTLLSGVNRWVKALVVLAAALGASVFLAVFALASASDLFGLNKEDLPIEVVLGENLSMSQIAAILKDNGVIIQPLTFQVYAGLKNDASDFVPGTYELNSNMSYDQIMTKFRTGNRQRVEVKILFYEGWTLRDIAKKLEEEGVCKASELYSYLDQDTFEWDFGFLKQVPDESDRYRRFEGYMFPDTYIFNKDEDVRQIVLKFFRNFNAKMTDDLMQKVSTSGMTLDQVITLASIIQREAATEEDMKLVSSVFHNRLNNPQQFPQLQSDVTIFYVRDNIKPFMNPNEVKLGEKDPNMPIYDSYDTYVRKGLPIGPICNPGMDAILAALEPATSDYFYFIADKDGVCHYAKTLEEHQRNIEEAGLNTGEGETHGTGTVSSQAAQ